VRLALQERFISNENWSILCESLAKHPTLKDLRLVPIEDDSGYTYFGGDSCVLTDVQKTSRMQSVSEMLEVHPMLHTIKLRPDERDTQIWTQAILPRLANPPQFRSVRQARDLSRSKLLVRALHTLLWMFLSSEVQAAFAGRMPKETHKRQNKESSTSECARQE
jgi:hypothetical protein